MEARKPYKKSMEYSYTLGAFPTFELIDSRPQQVLEVYVHSTFTEREKLRDVCRKNAIPIIEQDKLFQRLSDKENVFVIGVVQKFESYLDRNASHVVLVNPSNMGNLGTIFRTVLGFGIHDIALIRPGVDIFHPKVIRASMGSMFRLRCVYFNDFDSYRTKFPSHELFTFMLDGENTLSVKDNLNSSLFSLVFGNEASGLDVSYRNVGKSIVIPQTNEVDSLNLTIAVGIGVYLFTNQ